MSEPMNADTQSLKDDIAFLRALVQAGDDGMRAFGQGYFAAGVIYTGQVLLGVGQGMGLLPNSGLGGLAIILGPTAVFIAVIVWITRRNGAEPPSLFLSLALPRRREREPPSPTARALGTVFGATGLANFALIAVIGAVALREKSFTTWLIYPATVFILQGTAWFVSFCLRRRAWHAVLALFFIAMAVGMGLTAQDPDLYIVFVTLGLFFGMAVPGFILMRAPKTA
jgi:hypothetical protein